MISMPFKAARQTANKGLLFQYDKIKTALLEQPASAQSGDTTPKDGNFYHQRIIRVSSTLPIQP